MSQVQMPQVPKAERMSVNTTLLENIAGYLSTRPFAEVHELLGKLMQDAKAIPNAEAEKADAAV